jgi:hypothetical protein
MARHEGDISPNIFGEGAHSTSDNPESPRSSNDLAGDLAMGQPFGGPHRLVK